MVKNKGTETCKLQVTVDSVTDRLIGDISLLGFQGTTKSEVACHILRKWLWDNQEKLRQNGVRVASIDNS
jgi:hypothetical protein